MFTPTFSSTHATCLLGGSITHGYPPIEHFAFHRHQECYTLHQTVYHQTHLPSLTRSWMPLLPASSHFPQASTMLNPCIFLEYPSNHRGYRCLNLASNKIIISCHVTFSEDVFPFESMTKTAPPNYDFLLTNFLPVPSAPHVAQADPPEPNTPLGTIEPIPPTCVSDYGKIPKSNII